MFRRYLWVCAVIIGTVLGARAQQAVPEQLLNLNNPAVVNQKTTVTYGGTPAVLIESDKQTPTPPKAQAPKPADLSIQTPFGHDKTASFLDQATDFVSFIQVMDRDTVRVEERIQIVNTKPGAFFQRVLPQRLTAPDGQERQTSTHLLSVLINGEKASVDIQDIGTALILTGNEPLSPGLQNITLTYLVKGAIYQNQAVSDILLGLTGPAWPLMTERFTAVVFFPNQTESYQKELLFGSNNARIPNHFIATTDAYGNTVYQTTHPLPTWADVRLHMIVDSKAVPVPGGDFWVYMTSNTIAFLLCIGIVFLYTGASILSLIYEKPKKPMKELTRIHPLLWRVALGGKVTRLETETLLTVTGNQKAALTRLVHRGLFCRETQWLTNSLLRLFTFIRFNYEYMIGNALLIYLTVVMAKYKGVLLTSYQLCYLVLAAVVSVLVINRRGVRAQVTRFKKQIQDIFLTTAQGVNHSPKTMATYYPYAVCFGFAPEWRERLINHNPNYRELSFLKEEKQ